MDGKETKIYRANLAFRAVEVPKGKHTVVFKYVPMSFYIGLCLTIIGILLCIWLWRRDKKIDNRQEVIGDSEGQKRKGRELLILKRRTKDRDAVNLNGVRQIHLYREQFDNMTNDNYNISHMARRTKR